MSRHDLVVQRVRKNGLKVVCLNCSWEGRYKRQGREQPRLRARRCPVCAQVGYLKPRWWVLRYPERAASVGRDRREIERIALTS